jgi:DNA-binding response OmpR family regulator
MAEASRRVLVVDDEVVIRTLLVDALELEGFEVRCGADGEEALDIVESWSPDLIILDLMMPRMDGYHFRDEQRRRASIADIPVVILSAVRDLHQKTAGLAPAAVIPKPFDLDEVLDTVQRFTSESSD